MRASRYNLILDADELGTKLLFNAGSAALVEIDPASFPKVERLLADPKSASSAQDLEIVENLISGRFLVPERSDGSDEVELLHLRNRQDRVGNSTLFLTIAPTLACNFACEYCFESRSKLRMSPDVEEAVIELARRQLPQSEALFVTWFGGEPTLCLSTIERIQRALLDLAAVHGITIEPASIVTNGYQLDESTVERLVTVGVTEAQVTLDGPQETHDVRRRLRSGRGTFRTIVENLRDASHRMRIIVRVNVDQSNLAHATEVIEGLDQADILERVRLYFAPVNAADNVCADMRSRCFTTREFADAQLSLYRDLLERGFYGIQYPSLASGGHCGADTENSFVIGPNGYLFKCWEELSLDDACSVGHLLEPEATARQRNHLDRYRTWNPFEKRACRECHVLPICMGGCPRRGIGIDSAERGHCSPWKHNLEDMLVLRYLCERRKEVTS